MNTQQQLSNPYRQGAHLEIGYTLVVEDVQTIGGGGATFNRGQEIRVNNMTLINHNPLTLALNKVDEQRSNKNIRIALINYQQGGVNTRTTWKMDYINASNITESYIVYTDNIPLDDIQRLNNFPVTHQNYIRYMNFVKEYLHQYSR
jgi:hypothetical protein